MKTSFSNLWTGRRTKPVAPVLIALLLTSLGTSPLQADKCQYTTAEPAANEDYKIEGKADMEKRSWSYVLTNLKTKEQQTRPLPLIELHAHLYFFISQDSKYFAVLNGSADHHLTNRFMVYKLDGTLGSSLGIQDILKPYEEKMIERTVSHIHWLNRVQELTADEETALRETGKMPTLPPNCHYYGKYNPPTNTVSLRTLAGRIVVISLDRGKVVRGRKRRVAKQ